MINSKNLIETNGFVFYKSDFNTSYAHSDIKYKERKNYNKSTYKVKTSSNDVLIEEDNVSKNELNESYEEKSLSNSIKKSNTEQKNRQQILKNNILNIIMQDEYIDGEVSNSEIFVHQYINENNIKDLLSVLNSLLLDFYKRPDILEGVLSILSYFSYNDVYPVGQTISLSLLSHENLQIRDKAIQCYENWNSKKAIPILSSLKCSPKWLQNYVDEVIYYLKRNGND